MTDSEMHFIQQFEAHSLPPEEFDHRGHLYLAWLYLRRYSLDQAINKVTQGIADYAASLGAKDKFQHTLTEAVVRIMAVRMAHNPELTFAAFIEHNRDLLEDMIGVIAVHYSEERLVSVAARSTYLAPDREPIQ